MMESGSGPQSPAPGDGSDGPPPAAPRAPWSSPAPEPQPSGPQSPGPQSPGPGALPGGSIPGSSLGPQSPQGSQPPGYGGPQSPGYTGPVPPGGWQQPPAYRPGVQSQAPLAGWGARLGAWIIDGLIVVVPALIVLAVLGAGVLASSEGNSDAGVIAFVGGLILTFLVIAVISFIYAPLLMKRQGANNGQTWGKQLLGIRAVRDDSQPYTFGSAALREVVLKNLAVGIASSIIPLIPWFLNFFWPLWDDQNRALHDMAASSHVVQA